MSLKITQRRRFSVCGSPLASLMLIVILENENFGLAEGANAKSGGQESEVTGQKSHLAIDVGERVSAVRGV